MFGFTLHKHTLKKIATQLVPVSLSMLLNEFLSGSAWLKRGQFDEKVRMWILQQFIEILDMTQQVVW
jgi:hypothetical protein